MWNGYGLYMKKHIIFCTFKFFFFSLSQADQLMFAMHFVKGMYPELFQENVSVFVSAW